MQVGDKVNSAVVRFTEGVKMPREPVPSGCLERLPWRQPRHPCNEELRGTNNKGRRIHRDYNRNRNRAH